VRERWLGPMVVVLILGGVIAILAVNLNPRVRNLGGPTEIVVPGKSDQRSLSPPATASPIRQPADFREYPIGDEVEKNAMLIKAVWLPPIQMEGMADPAASNLIHLEADIHATEGNPNGFAKDEFIPYLVVNYTIAPADGKNTGAFKTIQGKMSPMVARDGLHYGATIEAPPAGRYKLTYALDPPSAGGLGRHVDQATGVAPWWKPFEASFDWEFSPKG
jgi:periplasmic iron binding protein